MKAYDILTYMISINIVLSIAAGIGIWAVPGLTGITPNQYQDGLQGNEEIESVSDISHITTSTLSAAVIAILGALIGALLITKLFPYAHHAVAYALLAGLFLGVWTLNANLVTALDPLLAGIPLTAIFYMMGIFLFIMLMIQSVIGGLKSHV